MKIVLDVAKKDGVLLKRDGTEISRYSFKNLLKDGFTFEEFQKDIENFNSTLAQHEDFDDMKKLGELVKLHKW